MALGRFVVGRSLTTHAYDTHWAVFPLHPHWTSSAEFDNAAFRILAAYIGVFGTPKNKTASGKGVCIAALRLGLVAEHHTLVWLPVQLELRVCYSPTYNRLPTGRKGNSHDCPRHQRYA